MTGHSESICRKCVHSYVCERFNQNRDSDNQKCHFLNDHFVPTIEAEPVRHRRWVKDSDGDEYCENCSRYMPVREVTGDPSANNYCPNCGAKMDGGGNDQT